MKSLIAATMLLPASITTQGHTFEQCLPRPMAEMRHAQGGFELDKTIPDSDARKFEIWRRPKDGQRFATVTEGSKTCFMGFMQPEQEI